MEFALAAGALVLSTVALVIAVWSSSARRRTSSPAPPRERSDGGSVRVGAVDPQATNLTGDAAATTPSTANTPGAGHGAQRAELRLAAVEAVARSRTTGDAARAAGRALRAFAPDATVEVRLGRTRVVGPPGDPAMDANPVARADRSIEPQVGAGCPVPTADACPAVRQAAVLTWSDSHSLDACPWLAVRDASTLSAVCAPVAVAGRGVGFLHIVGTGGTVGVVPASGSEVTGGDPAGDVVGDVAWLGAQLGALLDGIDSPAAVPSDSQATDPLIDLPSDPPAEPRSDLQASDALIDLPPDLPPDLLADLPTDFPTESPTELLSEPQATDPLPEPWPDRPAWSSPTAFAGSLDAFGALGSPYVLVVGGVDGVSELVAAVGHAAVESAVGALAVSLAADPDPLGPAEVVACSRLDQSTIAVAWSGLTLGRSVEVLELVRGELRDGAPPGEPLVRSWSFGLTHSSVSADPGEIIAVARAGLVRAQRLGGDQIVYADRSLLGNPPSAV